jgi:uncharacterized protein YecT (DUF1311 family)
VARPPPQKERIYLDRGRRTTQLMRDSLGGTTPMIRNCVLIPALVLAAKLDAQTSHLGTCDSAMTTLAMRQCLSGALDRADSALARYLKEARHQAQNAALLDTTQVVWERYRSFSCRAAGTQYEGGTMLPVVVLTCRLELTRARTHQLWTDYLQPDDSLPEP